MRTDGKIPSFVGKNVLLLVGINHTGGWHCYGGDLLTCALLAHAHKIHIHNTDQQQQQHKILLYTCIKYIRKCYADCVDSIHNTHSLRAYGPRAKNTNSNVLVDAWFFFLFFYQWHILLKFYLTHISITICSFNEKYKCVRKSDQDKSPYGIGKAFFFIRPVVYVLSKRKIETYLKHMLIPIFEIILSMKKKETGEKWLNSLKNDHHLTCSKF